MTTPATTQNRRRAPAVLLLELLHTTTGIASGVLVGRVPPGCYAIADILVETAFTDSGTDTISIGSNATSFNDLASGVDVSSTGKKAGTLCKRFASGADIYAKYAGQNGNADAGRALVAVTIYENVEFP